MVGGIPILLGFWCDIDGLCNELFTVTVDPPRRTAYLDSLVWQTLEYASRGATEDDCAYLLELLDDFAWRRENGSLRLANAPGM